MSAADIRIIVAGGGTGGHFFPAVAIADRIRELAQPSRNASILFVGTRRGIEYRMRETLGYPLHLVSIRGVARSLTLRNLMVPFLVVGSLINCYRLMARFRPQVVIGTGGYVCWPVLTTAAWRGIPTMLQEQNSYPGVSTRQLAGRATRIFLGFACAAEYLRTTAKVIVTGNPVRGTIGRGDRAAGLAAYGLDPSRRTILVLGGSQGARAINEAVASSLEAEALPEGIQILWQTGRRDYTEVTARTGGKAAHCALFPFAENMADVYAAADVVIARSGALTLAEITACELPSILVPYPQAAADHQKKNAEDYVVRGMADMIEQKDLPQHDIITEARRLLDSDRYRRMKSAIQRENAGRRPAADLIAEEVLASIDTRSAA